MNVKNTIFHIAYVKGGERERFNPLTGGRYEKLQTHDLNEPEDLAVASSSTSSANRESYVSRRGCTNQYLSNRDNSNWRGGNRSKSPYQKPAKEAAKPSGNASKDKPA